MRQARHSAQPILVCLVFLVSGLSTPVLWSRPTPVVVPIPRTKPAVRVLYVEVEEWKPTTDGIRADQRLPKEKFKVSTVPWKKLNAQSLKGVDVVFLPTMWAWDTKCYRHLESMKNALQNFVKQGGGLFVCQPNPSGRCTPTLLPYPITFQNGYKKDKPERENLVPNHFITEDLPPGELPFPADPMIQIDRRYEILVRQISTGWPSLAVCKWGQGRIVIQTANENSKSNIPISDRILSRMILWSARREPTR